VTIVAIIVGGLIVGALARLAVPGPDPMPWWATIGLGIAGSLLGGVVASLIGLPVEYGFVAALLGAIIVLIGYRRWVQKRGITGPTATERPRRGIGL
jgi:uncharacterized membrane protein YeaQ/YmgE (transglycosylase-associated protein family)